MGWKNGWVAASALLLLAACGGGGGGAPAPAPSPAGPRDPLPVVTQDLNPAGARLDLRNRNYFAGAPGDRWTFSQVGQDSTVVTVTRSVAGAASGPDLIVTESTADQTDENRYRRTAEGLLAVMPLSGQVPDAMNQRVGDLLEYPEPFYPVGSTRRMIRQGPMGEDIDGDGVLDSFRLEVTQQLVGFESVSLFNGSVVPEAAHFHNVWTLTLQGSDRRNEPDTAVFIEDAWWAPRIGLVQARRASAEASAVTTAPIYTLTLTAGNVAGRDVFGPDGTLLVVPLTHNAVVHDPVRQRYYATLPADGTNQGNRVATIDPRNGDITYGPQALGADPFAMVINADASALYVGLKGDGQVVKLRLPDFAELWRVTLPAPPAGGQWLPERLAVSPTGDDVVAVSMRRTGSQVRHAGVALIRDGVLQPRMTAPGLGANLLAFGTDGTTLFGHEAESPDGSLRRLAVLADGVEEVQAQALASPLEISSIDVGPVGVVLDGGVYRTADLSLVGRPEVSGGGCRVAGPTRLLCAHRPADAYMPGDAAVAIVDAGSLAVLDTPIYYRGFDRLVLSEIVPGPSGQVALRMNARFHDASSDLLLLFTSNRLP